MNIQQCCPLCGASLPITFESQDYISGEVFRVGRCKTHELAMTLVPADIDISRYYGSSYYGSKGKRFVGPLESIIGAFRKRRANSFAALFSKPGCVLDIGCGRGLTLSFMKGMGWECFGTELSPELAEQARNQHGIDVRTAPDLRSCGFAGEQFDLVTMFHVLEHVPDSVAVLREINRILKPGGKLVIEVPNFGSLQAGFAPERWFHLDVPRHLIHFSTHSLLQLLGDHGMQIRSTSTHSLEYGYYGMLQTLLNRFTRSMNVMYAALKRVKAEGHGASAAKFLLHIVLAILLAPFAFLIELGACAAGVGGITRVVAEKSPQ